MPRPALSLRLLVVILTVTAVFASAAAAEMPRNADVPTITDAGGPVVGETLVGNNGTWLYDNGLACRDECTYTWAWQRCIRGGACAAIPGAVERAYVVGAVDVGRTLRVAVTATKYDCNAHGKDCRHVSRAAVSAQTAQVPAPPASPARLTISRLGITPAGRGRLALGVRVTDESGRAMRGARVAVAGAGAPRAALTANNGSVRLVLRLDGRARQLGLAIRAERPGATATSLEIRVPLR